MDPASISWEILVILLLVALNAILSLMEMAVVSSRKSRLEQLTDEGVPGAAEALMLAEEPADLLSAVQVGITLVGIGTGAFSGATLASPLGAVLREFSLAGRYADMVAYGIVVFLVTYLSLVFGELAPKRIALNEPEKLAIRFSSVMGTLIRFSRPLTWLLSRSTRSLLRAAGIRPTNAPPVTEEEVRVLLDQGTEHGIFEASEQEMIENVFSLGDTGVNALMTPRTQIEWLDLDDPAEQNVQLLAQKRYSCFVAGRGSLDEVAGIIYTKDFLARRLLDGNLALEEVIRQPLYVPENMTALRVLDLFKRQRTKIALVVDEFGGLAGLVTLRDVMEHLVGELPSYDEADEPYVVTREDGSWLLDGMLVVDELKELLGVAALPDEERVGFQTLGGFVVSHMGAIPATGELFEWGGYRFEVLDMDGTRVDKVLVVHSKHEETPTNLVDPE